MVEQWPFEEFKRKIESGKYTLMYALYTEAVPDGKPFYQFVLHHQTGASVMVQVGGFYREQMENYLAEKAIPVTRVGVEAEEVAV
jgi:hypothetical protein